MTDALTHRWVLLALVVGGGWLVSSTAAQAKVYPVPISIETEEDLNNYVGDGVLEDDDLQTLLELFHDPIDINSANRRDFYDLPGVSASLAQRIVKDRREHGDFTTLSRMLRVDGMSTSILDQLRPFVEVVARPEGRHAYSGYARIKVIKSFQPIEPVEDDNPYKTHTVAQVGKDKWPDAYLKARVKYGGKVEVGVLGLMQDDALRAWYSQDTRDITLKWGQPAFEFGKAYATATRGHVSGIVGSYVAGFGSGLTFDRSSRSHPHGFYRDLNITGTETYRLSKGLFGGAVRLIEWRPGDLSVDATAFASSRRYDLYQYDMGLAGGEDVDVLTDELDSPRVFVDGQKVGWVTIPNAYRESVLGGNVTLGFKRRTWVGLTSYVGHLDTTALKGSEDPNDWVIRGGYPNTRDYGAVGVNIDQVAGPLEIFGEYTLTFSGGQGALVEAIYDGGFGTIEASVRRYGTDFDNPHARGLAAADEYGGMRDRDEQGARLQVELEPLGWVKLRSFADYWQNISTGRSNMELYGRLQLQATHDLRFVLYGDTKNRDLANNGRTRVYGGEYVSSDTLDGSLTGEDYIDQSDDTSVDVIDGAGAKHYAAVQVRYDGIPGTSLQAFYKRIYEDAGLVYPNGTAICEPWYMIGHYTWFKAVVKPVDKTQVSWRIRYEDDDLFGSHGDRNLETYLQLTQKLPYRMKASLRGTMGWDLADAPAEWADACGRAGVPDLNGSCVATDTGDDQDLYTTGKPYGLVQAALEGRF